MYMAGEYCWMVLNDTDAQENYIWRSVPYRSLGQDEVGGIIDLIRIFKREMP